MKSIWAIVAVLTMLPIQSVIAETESQPKPETLAEKFAYTLGFEIGKNIQKGNLDIDLETYIRGFKDSMEGNNPLFTDEEMREFRMEFNKQHREGIAKDNLEEGKKWLAKNAKKEGVATTDSGLQYLVLKKADGPSPKADDKVKVHYKGQFIDGKVFDSSYKRKQPAAFGVNEVIKGWTEVLQLMKVGEKYQVFIPPDLAYGERGQRNIEPNATLIFEIELLSIEEKTAKKPQKQKVLSEQIIKIKPQ